MVVNNKYYYLNTYRKY